MDSKDVISLCLSQSPPPSNTSAAHRIQRIEPQSSNHAHAKFCTIVSERLDEGDIRAAVRIACSSDVVAPYDVDSYNKLQMKHPSHPPDRRAFLTCDPAPLQFTAPDVGAAVSSFNPGAAGGASGLRPQHLKDAFSRRTGDARSRLLLGLTNVVNIILAGSVPLLFCPILPVHL